MAMLTPLESRTSPFDPSPPKSSDRLHWVRPELVAQIKFTEWTDDQHLRHPVYLGLRDDKRARDVVREGTRAHRFRDTPPSGAGTEPAASAAAENKRRSRTSTSGNARTHTSTPREGTHTRRRTAVTESAASGNARESSDLPADRRRR